jgi:hypothetical protein
VSGYAETDRVVANPAFRLECNPQWHFELDPLFWTQS